MIDAYNHCYDPANFCATVARIGCLNQTLSTTHKNKRECTMIALLRPKQWIKNGLVLAPLIFSLHFAAADLHHIILAFASFCLAASTIYVLNDIADTASDRQHPKKRFRPLAAGAVTINQAIVLAALCAAGSLVLAYFLPIGFMAIVLAYIDLNIAYSLWLKRLLIIDVMTIAIGFVLRVIGGAIAIGVVVSHWILICTFFVALFIGFAKRKNENDVMQTGSKHHRSVLLHYTPDFLNQLIALTSGMSIIGYALYTIDPETIRRFGTDRLIYTLPIVVYGIFRYFHLIYNTTDGGDPSQIFFTDTALAITIAVWLISFALLVAVH